MGLARGLQVSYTRDPILSVSFVITGIVFLMTVKPGLEESLTVIGAATAGGVLASLDDLTRSNHREGRGQEPRRH